MKAIILVGQENKKFEHDCECCKLLGHRTGERPSDLYICTEGEPCLIARYSDEPSDNVARSVEMMEHLSLQNDTDDLGKAYQLANVLGHLEK